MQPWQPAHEWTPGQARAVCRVPSNAQAAIAQADRCIAERDARIAELELRVAQADRVVADLLERCVDPVLARAP